MPVEILVADSRQVYRGMDIGTAKPDAAARAAVPHHLIDLVDPDEPFTVADWVERARGPLPEIAARGRLPMLVGGTGLYVAALVDGHDYAAQASLGRSPRAPGPAARCRGSRAARRPAQDAGPRDAAARIDLQQPAARDPGAGASRGGGGSRGAELAPYAGRVALVGIGRPREVLYRAHRRACGVAVRQRPARGGARPARRRLRRRTCDR